MKDNPLTSREIVENKQFHTIQCIISCKQNIIELNENGQFTLTYDFLIALY